MAIEPIKRIKGRRILKVIFIHDFEKVTFLRIKYVIKRKKKKKKKPMRSVVFICNIRLIGFIRYYYVRPYMAVAVLKAKTIWSLPKISKIY